MAGQGFPNEGADHRAFGFLAPLVRLISWQSAKQPVMQERPVRFAYTLAPPYFCLNIDFGTHWRLIRFGWRYDPNWAPKGGYIFGAAFKKISAPLIWY